MTKVCGWCARLFEGTHNQRYCCPQCAKNHKTVYSRRYQKPHSLIKAICPICGKEFMQKTGNQTCCSPECSHEMARRKHRVFFMDTLHSDNPKAVPLLCAASGETNCLKCSKKRCIYD